MNTPASLLALFLTGSLLVACAPSHSDSGRPQAMPAAAHMTSAQMDEAIAVVQPTEGNSAHGVVHFRQVDDGVEVTADVSGLPPDSDHGFHIHEFGDASAPNGNSAGGHYNPEGFPHAGPHVSQRHAGDLGNLHADAGGRAQLRLTVHHLTIAGPHNSILGRAVVVHKDPDDLRTQPTGNSGARLGVGVIGIAQKPIAAP